jgi:transcriptional regulator with XRE-family HTH domain
MLNRAKSGAASSRRLEVVNQNEEQNEVAMEVRDGTDDRDAAGTDSGQPRRLPGYAQMHSRNREIGALLKQARMSRDESSESVAKLIGTSRRRYAAMERGEALIGAVELDVLRKHFGIPAAQLWHAEIETGNRQGKRAKSGRQKVAASDQAQAVAANTDTGATTTPSARLLLVEVTPGEEILIRTKLQ